MTPGAGRLALLRDAIAKRAASATPGAPTYSVPAAWIDPSAPAGRVDVDPVEFLTRAIDSILKAPPPTTKTTPPGSAGGAWSRLAVVYDLFIRLACAWDHDNDGLISPGPSRAGWRETGTFPKAIAVLPYIRSLGFDTIHLLPVQEIGMDGRRGNLGSPYAVRDPRAIDGGLAEELPGCTAADQFGAFVEAAHRLGMRVVLELPLRTQSKDCVWAGDHPDWFYWIRDGVKFVPPVFSPAEIRDAHRAVDHGNYDGAPVPCIEYRDLFRNAPRKGSVGMVGDRWIGRENDGATVVVPGAFADWPPDDRQPVWGDVTYLKYYQDPTYNYVAYNTIRMFDSTLLGGGTETVELWSELAGLVAWYAGEFGIDGLMIDMAHALPEGLALRIIREARAVKRDFAFWAEDFSRTADQVRLGYDAVLGGQWACQHRRRDFRDMLAWLGRTPELLPHLAAPETHNTPRAAAREGGPAYARWAWIVSCLIPGVPYLQAGFEFNETSPVNTGLGFTPEELERFPAERLPLFSALSLDWNSPVDHREIVRTSLAIRKRFEAAITGPGASFDLLDAGDERVLAFSRAAPGGGPSFSVAANADTGAPADFRIPAPPGTSQAIDLLSGARFETEHGFFRGRLAPGQVAVFGAGGGK